MMRSQSTNQSSNSAVKLRRSERLADKFLKLPNELTAKIFSKMEDDPKSLIRCSAVCKNWASFVFKTAHLSLIFSITGERGRSLHNHISLSAIPAMMMAFSNLKSIEIKLCRCPSPFPYPPYYQNITKMKVAWTGDDSQADTCLAFELGLLSTIQGVKLPRKLSEDKIYSVLVSSSVMDFYCTMLDYRPKTLRKLVITSAKLEGFKVKPGGKVFVRYEQLSKLRDSISNSQVNKSWLEDPQNVLYWHKNNTYKNDLLQEQVWVAYQWQFLPANRKFSIQDLNLKETDVMDMLVGLDADADDNGIGKCRSWDRH